MVRQEGLEPPRLAASGPKPDVSTNSTTGASAGIVAAAGTKATGRDVPAPWPSVSASSRAGRGGG